EDGPQPVLDPRQRLVDGHAGPAGVGEDDVDAVADEALDQDVGPAHRGAGAGGRGTRLAHDLDLARRRKRRPGKQLWYYSGPRTRREVGVGEDSAGAVGWAESSRPTALSLSPRGRGWRAERAG